MAAGPSPASTQSAEEYNVESADYIADIISSDVLTTPVGKRSMKVNLLQFTYP